MTPQSGDGQHFYADFLFKYLHNIGVLSLPVEQTLNAEKLTTF